MAKLMVIIVRHAVVLDGDAFTQMETLLHDAVNGPYTPLLTRNHPHFIDDKLRILRKSLTRIGLATRSP
jgi:hypothetical protein